MSTEHPWLSYVTITDPQRLEPFAEFGIVLLLFSSRAGAVVRPAVGDAAAGVRAGRDGTDRLRAC
jgi:hypothetical protein